MASRVSALGAFLLAGFLLAGCANDSVAGLPTPLTTAVSGAISATNSKPPLPVRPKSLPLDGVNPCILFPADRRAEFGVTEPLVGPNVNGLETSCGGSSRTGVGVNITADRERGAAYFLGDKPLSYGEPDTVADYPAVRSYTKADKNRECFVVIDVAEGQNLSVQYSDFGRPGTDVLCPLAEKVAVVALDALKAQKK